MTPWASGSSWLTAFRRGRRRDRPAKPRGRSRYRQWRGWSRGHGPPVGSRSAGTTWRTGPECSTRSRSQPFDFEGFLTVVVVAGVASRSWWSWARGSWWSLTSWSRRGRSWWSLTKLSSSRTSSWSQKRWSPSRPPSSATPPCVPCGCDASDLVPGSVGRTEAPCVKGDLGGLEGGDRLGASVTHHLGHRPLGMGNRARDSLGA